MPECRNGANCSTRGLHQSMVCSLPLMDFGYVTCPVPRSGGLGTVFGGKKTEKGFGQGRISMES